MQSHKDIIKELSLLKNPSKAKILSGYFKTGKGQYGEGDIFLGITVPLQRGVAKKFVQIDIKELEKLLNSKIHEHRFTALEILVLKYENEHNIKNKEKLVKFYLKNLKYVNNWDLVDTSASYILGDYLLLKKDRNILYKLIKSKNLWQRRVSIVACLSFIKNNDFKDILNLGEMVFKDKEDLIAKAYGWMLREVYKKDKKVLVEFLNRNYKKMQRVSLRYCLERFPKKEKQIYMKI